MCTIADAQHWDTTNELREIDLKGLRVMHREGRSRKDNTDNRFITYWELVIRQNFAESVEFAHATADKLCRLRTEIQNDDFLLHINNI